MSDRSVDTQFLTNVLVIPKAKTAASPQVLAWNLGAVTLDMMEFAFPAGVAFLGFIQIMYAGTVIVPWGNPGTWLTGNSETVQVKVGMDIDGGLTIRGYNTDKVNAHSIYLRAHVTVTSTLAQASSGTAQQPITPAQATTPDATDIASTATLAAVPTVADTLIAGQAVGVGA